MQSFNIGKYVWFDVSGIPGNTVIYIATSVQKLKTGKKNYKKKPSQIVWNQVIQVAFIMSHRKIIFDIFIYLFPQNMHRDLWTPSTDTVNTVVVY